MRVWVAAAALVGLAVLPPPVTAETPTGGEVAAEAGESVVDILARIQALEPEERQALLLTLLMMAGAEKGTALEDAESEADPSSDALARACLKEAILLGQPEIGENRLSFAVTNRLDWPVSGVRIGYRILSPRRSVPWASDETVHSVAGGIEPGETREVDVWISGPPSEAADGIFAEVEILDVADAETRLLVGQVSVASWSREPSPNACNPDAFVKAKLPEAPESTDASQELPPEVLAVFIESVQRCWNVPAGLRDSGELELEFAAELTPSGEIIASSIKPAGEKLADGREQQLFEAARRALIRCSPYTELPRARFPAWRHLQLTFGPEGPIAPEG